VRVRYSAWALLEIDEIGEYIASDNAQAADRVVREIRRLANSLARFPRRGRKQRGKNIRKIGTRKHPYNIYYSVDETIGEVLILNVRHTARRRKRRYQDT
jgi:toxin ParE1/3/4